MTPTLIVTRPKAQGEGFAKAVRAKWGKPVEIVLSPLIEIEFLPVLADLAGMENAIFTSVNGVGAAGRLGLPPGIKAWCVGAKTATAARNAGFDAVTGPGDAAGLIDMVIADKPTGPLTHFRGTHARGDISKRLAAAGLICRDVVAYDQKAQHLTKTAMDRLAGQSAVVLPLFSPRSATILAGYAPFKAPLDIIAMSDAVAEAAAPLTPQNMLIAAQPDEEAMLDATTALLARLAVNQS